MPIIACEKTKAGRFAAPGFCLVPVCYCFLASLELIPRLAFIESPSQLLPVGLRAEAEVRGGLYFRCLLTSLVISNMFTIALPPKTGFSAASALIMRLFFGSWSLFFLM